MTIIAPSMAVRRPNPPYSRICPTNHPDGVIPWFVARHDGADVTGVWALRAVT